MITTKTHPTFRTFDLDTAGAITADIGEFPIVELDHITTRVAMLFCSPDAPMAAARYRRNHKLQAIFVAKRQIWAEMQRAMEGRRQ